MYPHQYPAAYYAPGTAQHQLEVLQAIQQQQQQQQMLQAQYAAAAAASASAYPPAALWPPAATGYADPAMYYAAAPPVSPGAYAMMGAARGGYPAYPTPPVAEPAPYVPAAVPSPSPATVPYAAYTTGAYPPFAPPPPPVYAESAAATAAALARSAYCYGAPAYHQQYPPYPAAAYAAPAPYYAPAASGAPMHPPVSHLAPVTAPPVLPSPPPATAAAAAHAAYAAAMFHYQQQQQQLAQPPSYAAHHQQHAHHPWPNHAAQAPPTGIVGAHGVPPHHAVPPPPSTQSNVAVDSTGQQASKKGRSAQHVSSSHNAEKAPAVEIQQSAKATGDASTTVASTATTPAAITKNIAGGDSEPVPARRTPNADYAPRTDSETSTASNNNRINEWFRMRQVE